MAPPPESWSRLIAASVVPVVVISACGLLCLALYNRLAAIVSRLRSFQRERLHEQELHEKAKEGKNAESLVRHERMIDLLDAQTSDVSRRARLIRRALKFFLAAIAAMILCSLCCGSTVVLSQMIYVAAPLFIVGMLLLLGGVSCAYLEMQASLGPVELESEVIALLAP